MPNAFNNGVNQPSTRTSQSYSLDSTMDYCLDYIETIYDDDVFGLTVSKKTVS